MSRPVWHCQLSQYQMKVELWIKVYHLPFLTVTCLWRQFIILNYDKSILCFIIINIKKGMPPPSPAHPTLIFTQLCLDFLEPQDYREPGILLARIMEWVAFSFSRGSSQLRDQTQVSHIVGRFFPSWDNKFAYSSCPCHLIDLLERYLLGSNFGHMIFHMELKLTEPRIEVTQRQTNIDWPITYYVTSFRNMNGTYQLLLKLWSKNWW